MNARRKFNLSVAPALYSYLASRRELARVFRPQIDKIEALRDRSLSHWTKGPEED
jgi:hypothetical protein